MERKPIKTEEQYDEALHYIYNLMQQEIIAGSPKADDFEAICTFVKEYENIHYPMPKPMPQPLEAIKTRMAQLNMTESQLADILGYRSRKSEILSGKRKLSLAMIRKLHEVLAIPAEVLIQAY